MSKVGDKQRGKTRRGPTPASIAAATAANKAPRSRVPSGLSVEEIVSKRQAAGTVGAQGKSATRSKCCGSLTKDVICCAIDPRANPDGPGRLAGDWCCWCGKDGPEGQSYCDRHCSRSYHEDIFEDEEGKRSLQKIARACGAPARYEVD